MTDRNKIPEDRRAPNGQIWQCGACGKMAEDKYGMIGWHSRGWDESCMLNSVLVQYSEKSRALKDLADLGQEFDAE